MKVRVYVEGGGDGRNLRMRCRRALSAFLEKATLAGHMPRIVASGSRRAAFDDFCAALGASTQDEFIVLLVDSEGPVPAGAGPWRHLRERDGWEQPADATDENAHLMVQCMENWFLSDQETLATYFKRGFNANALPGGQHIEEVAKTDVLDGLRNATRQCQSGRYDKGRHSFAILERADAAKILSASPHAQRLVDTLREKAA